MSQGLMRGTTAAETHAYSLFRLVFCPSIHFLSICFDCASRSSLGLLGQEFCHLYLILLPYRFYAFPIFRRKVVEEDKTFTLSLLLFGCVEQMKELRAGFSP